MISARNGSSTSRQHRRRSSTTISSVLTDMLSTLLLTSRLLNTKRFIRIGLPIRSCHNHLLKEFDSVKSQKKLLKYLRYSSGIWLLPLICSFSSFVKSWSFSVSSRSCCCFLGDF